MKALLIKRTDTIIEVAIIYVTMILVAATIFAVAENKSFLDSVWWACVTATTVGYGDFYPATVIGRITGVIIMHASIFFIAPLIVVRILTSIIVDTNAFTHAEQEEIKQRLKSIEEKLNDR